MNTTNLKTTGTRPDLTLVQRILAPTPSFFQKVRNIGMVLGVIGTALLAAPVTLPAVVVTIAGYLTLAGSITTAVAQTAVKGE
jgi:hypothetical protein